MISFSNMDVETCINLTKSYGTFSIALKKDWGAKNKLNPVLYLERNSDFTNQIISSFERLKQFSNKEIESSLRGGLLGDKHLFAKTLIDLFSHSKNYDGRLVRGNKEIDPQYSFGLEREWRYLVTAKEYVRYLIGNEIDRRQDYNKSIEGLKIDFLSEEIDTIVVETEYEQTEIIEILKAKYGESLTKPKIIINTVRHIPDYS